MTSSDRVNVRLSDAELAAIDARVEDGEFHSRSAVVRAALREFSGDSGDRSIGDMSIYAGSDIFDAAAERRRR